MLDKIYHTLFLSTPSARRATRCPLCERLRDLRFLSTPSARRATLFRVLGGKPYQNFYPRPPRGGRPRRICNTAGARSFLSTPSARRATATPPIPENSFEFLSTPSARRATRSSRCCASTQQFLSTPSARRATVEVAAQSRLQFISIHALREEGDASVLGTIVGWVSFLSTPSARRATRARGQVRRPVPISIHALREEGDLPSRQPQTLAPHFYPRPPRGGRPAPAPPALPPHNFYPRPPRGGRPASPSLWTMRANFYPRPPRGGRRHAVLRRLPWKRFLSTPSARRATQDDH